MAINPRISSFIEDDKFLRFTLSDCNVSVANSIRRVILSDIPTFVFRTFPYNENKAEIYVNTTRLNNEIIKQRLGCIPIHIDDMNFPYKNYMVELDVKNDTDTIQYITTKDFKIKNVLTDQYSSESSVRRIFPPDRISGDYIRFARLLPKLSENIDGERLSLKCGFDIGTAKQDGMFNVACTCSYSNTLDEEKAKQMWNEIETKMKKEGSKDEEIEFEKKNWYLLEAKRNYIPDSFDFIIETIGVFSNRELLIKACNILINKCKKFIDDIQNGIVTIERSDSTLQNGYDITLVNEDYTLGKVIEFYLYDNHYFGDKTLSYCGFRKNHPHDLNSLIRLGYHKATDSSTVSGYLQNSAEIAIEAYKSILSQLMGETELGGLETQVESMKIETPKMKSKTSVKQV